MRPAEKSLENEEKTMTTKAEAESKEETKSKLSFPRPINAVINMAELSTKPPRKCFLFGAP